jgi:hypothetical protein
MRHDHLPQPRPPLTDQAAAEILDFLYELVSDFESAYYAKIRRYRQRELGLKHAQEQLRLFDDSESTDPF